MGGEMGYIPKFFDGPGAIITDLEVECVRVWRAVGQRSCRVVNSRAQLVPPSSGISSPERQSATNQRGVGCPGRRPKNPYHECLASAIFEKIPDGEREGAVG